MPGSPVSLLISERVRRRLLVLIALSGLGYVYLSAKSVSALHYAQSGTDAALSAAVRLDPDNAEFWQQLGLERLYEQNNPDAAIADFQRALGLNPRNADSWIGMAFSYQFLGKATEERDAIARALQVEPRRPDIVWQAANLYAVLGDHRLMLNELCIVLRHDRTRADAALDLAYRLIGSRAADCAVDGQQN